MKKLLLIVALGILFFTGCDNKEKSNELFVFNNDPVLDKYETKKLQEGVTYKEIAVQDDGELSLYIVVYNNTDKAIKVEASVKGYSGTKKTSQRAQRSSEYVAPNSSTYLGFSFMHNADNYKFETFAVSEMENVIGINSFSHEASVITDETLSVYFKTKKEFEYGKNKILGFKNGELVLRTSCSPQYVDDNNNVDYNKEIRKGDRVGCEMDYLDFFDDDTKLSDVDKFISFVNAWWY